MNSLRIPTTNTTEQAKVQNLINEVYRDVWMKSDWWFLFKRGVVNTVAQYTTGTVTVTNLSTAATFGTAPAVGLGSFAGYSFRVTGDTNDNNAVYVIATHTAGAAAFTLDANFTGNTSTTDAFTVAQDRVALPTDLGKLLWVKRFGRDFPVELISPERMAEVKVSDLRVGKPEIACVLDFSTTGDPTTARVLVVHPYPDKTYRLELGYKQELNTELTGATQPLIPDEYRHLLVYGALARGYPIFLSDTERGDSYTRLFNDVLALMSVAHRERGQSRPQIALEDMQRRRFPPRRLRHISLGALFDVWPSEP